MTAILGRKNVTLKAELQGIGWEVTKLMREHNVSYRKILMNTGIDRLAVQRIERGGKYHIDTYLKVIK